MDEIKTDLLKQISHYDLDTLRAMKSSLSDFFACWVSEESKLGILEGEVPVWNFKQIKYLIELVEEYKIKEGKMDFTEDLHLKPLLDKAF